MKKMALATTMLALSASVYAGEAYVCHSPEVSIFAEGQRKLDNNTTFTCEGSVKGTIPALAKQGWKIVQVAEQSGTPPTTDPMKTTAYFSMVIQKD